VKRMRKMRRGNAAVEFAVAAPLLLTMLAGVVDVGFGLFEAMQAQNAAETGALYASRHGWDQAGIIAAVTGATNVTGISATPAPTQFCGCASASGVTQAACTATCSGGGAPGLYVQVNATLAHQHIMPYASFGVPDTLSGKSLLRLQ